MDVKGEELVAQLSELMAQRERALALRGEWKNVNWQWRQAWRAAAADLAWTLDRLGKGYDP